MRHEIQHWDAIRASLELVVAGMGQTGLSPLVGIQRRSDGRWLANGGGSWQVAFATNTMTEPDATNQPGAYEYAIPSGQLAYAQSVTGYRMVITESTLSIRENVRVVGARAEWAETLTWGSVVAGSQGEELLIINALRQNNVRVVYDTYDVGGKPLHGYVYVYASKAALEADISPWAGAEHSWEFDASYDGLGRIEFYTSTRET